MPEIQDVIVTDTPQTFLLLDHMPEFAYQRTKQYLHATDGDFASCFEIKRPTFQKAFAGREFNLPMQDGSSFHCHGQVWSTWNGRLFPGEWSHVAAATRESLAECYVFRSIVVRKEALNAWLASHRPKRDYYSYDAKGALGRQRGRANLWNRSTPPTWEKAVRRHAPEGTEPDELCNRDGCDGILILDRDGDECSCHISSPCTTCVDATVYCPECNTEVF